MPLRCAIVLIVAASFVQASPATPAENPDIARARATERRIFSDAEIASGFFKIAFGAEFSVAGRVDRIRKYVDPIRIYVDNHAKPDRRALVAGVVADIRSRIDNIDIALTETYSEANVIVTLVRDRDLGRWIRKLYGSERARQIQTSLEPQCLSGFSKDDRYRILRSDVLIVADAGEFIFFDCVYEELLQALGPINDDDTVPWTMFNDDVQRGFFGIYDQYLLNILYHPLIEPGMTREEVAALLPQVLRDVRVFVAARNGLTD